MWTMYFIVKWNPESYIASKFHIALFSFNNYILSFITLLFLNGIDVIFSMSLNFYLSNVPHEEVHIMYLWQGIMEVMFFLLHSVRGYMVTVYHTAGEVSFDHMTIWQILVMWLLPVTYTEKLNNYFLLK